jgi:hypothetical protein
MDMDARWKLFAQRALEHERTYRQEGALHAARAENYRRMGLPSEAQWSTARAVELRSMADAILNLFTKSELDVHEL